MRLFKIMMTALMLMSSTLALANDFLTNTTVKTNLFGQLGYFAQSDDQAFHVPGVITHADAVHNEEGVEFMHGELGTLIVFEALVAGKIILGSHHGERVEVEALWLQPHLGEHLTLRVGRQLMPIGLNNAVHEHDRRFVDASLSQQAFLASQYQDDSVYLTYTNGLYDMTVWVGEGDSFPATSETNGLSPSAFGLTYQWQGIDHSYHWRVVSSIAYFDANSRGGQSEHHHSHSGAVDNQIMFDGDTTLLTIGVDWQWQHLGVEMEWMGQQVKAQLTDSQQINNDLDGFQYGISSQLYWETNNVELALRYDAVLSDNEVTYDNAEFRSVLDGRGLHPQRLSAVLNWRFMTNQMLRIQTNYDEVTVEGKTAFWIIYQGNLTW